MAISGSLATVRSQTASHPFFIKAFAYLDEVTRSGSEANKRATSVPVGESQRIELGDGIFALEQAYNTKARTDGKWESHRKFIDVQVILVGVEIMEVCEISRLKQTQDLTPGKDMIFYGDTIEGSAIRLNSGEAAILFPPDGHKPGIRVDQPTLVRKVVVKVPVF